MSGKRSHEKTQNVQEIVKRRKNLPIMIDLESDSDIFMEAIHPLLLEQPLQQQQRQQRQGESTQHGVEDVSPKITSFEKNILHEINTVSVKTFKPVVKMQQLQPGVKYPYSVVRKVTTKFHPEAVVVELEDSQIFLPARASAYTKEQLSFLNDKRDCLAFVYEGTKQFNDTMSTNLFKFIENI